MKLSIVFSPKMIGGILSTSKRLTNVESLIEKFDVRIPDIQAEEIEKYILKVHSKEYFEKTKNFPFFKTAIESLKCVIKAASLIKDYNFILIPTSGTGYSAKKDKLVSYCCFNDVAILVEKLIENGYKRIAVINFDAHHGNFSLIEGKAVCLCIMGREKCKIVEKSICKPIRELSKEECIERLKKNVEELEKINPNVVVWCLGQDLHNKEYSEMDFDKDCYTEIFKSMIEIAKKRKLIVLFSSGSREDVFTEIIECLPRC